MKVRWGWRITWADGTAWDGDCPKWAAAGRTPGSTISRIKIIGGKRWGCSACIHGSSH